jgi:hypothetical protein
LRRIAGAYYPASDAENRELAHVSFVIEITIEASRQATRMTSMAAQRRGIG